jgi:hypothetical protein
VQVVVADVVAVVAWLVVVLELGPVDGEPPHAARPSVMAMGTSPSTIDCRRIGSLLAHRTAPATARWT